MSTAHADEADERSAADVAGAPPPGEESGRVDDEDGDSVGREIGRGLLFVPRVAFEVVSTPVRGGIWAYERYRLRDRWFQIFFNDARTVGVYPVVRYEAGFGINAGGRFVARDLFGKREHGSVRFTSGGTHTMLAESTLRTGDRLGRFEVELAAEHERRARDRFYGIGNADDREPTMMIDPLARDAAVSTRYRQELSRASLVVDTAIASALRVRTAGALTQVAYGPSETGTSIEEVFMTDRVVGFDGVRHAYADVELVWDSRRSHSRWEPAPIASVGWLASIYGGRMAVEDRRDFWRYGADGQYLFRIASGPRVIATRVHFEAVTGSIEEVPFDELPRLGGRELLRGYTRDRFRDRAAGLGTIEYRWDLSKYIMASAFVDVGRVAPTIEDIFTGEARVGYGVGLDGFTESSFLVRATIESSADGDVFLNVAFDPAFDLDPRVERR